MAPGAENPFAGPPSSKVRFAEDDENEGGDAGANGHPAVTQSFRKTGFAQVQMDARASATSTEGGGSESAAVPGGEGLREGDRPRNSAGGPVDWDWKWRPSQYPDEQKQGQGQAQAARV